MREYQHQPYRLASMRLQTSKPDEKEASQRSSSRTQPDREATLITAQTVKSGDPLLSVGGSSSAALHSLTRSSLVQLQRSHGNRYVQRILQMAGADGQSSVASEVEQTIERTRGGGQPLDSTASTEMGQAFNANFSGVRIHANAESDVLNRTLNARAFTTGMDVYFRHGEYKPGSSSGRELLAHELTHVVQQNGGRVRAKAEEKGPDSTCAYCGQSSLSRSVQPKLSLGRPNDIYEQEADNMAQAYSAWERKVPSRDASSKVQRQPEEEEEQKLVQSKQDRLTVSRQIEQQDEQEMAQTKLQETSVQRLRPDAEELEELGEAGAEYAAEQNRSSPLAVSTVTNIMDVNGADRWATEIEGYRGRLQQGRETRTVSDGQISANERVIGALRDYQAMGGEQTRTLTDFQRQAQQVRVDFGRLRAQFTHLQVSGFVERNQSAGTQAEQLVAGHGFRSGEEAAAGIRGANADILRGQVEEAHTDAMRLGSRIASDQEEVSAAVYDFQAALNSLKAGIVPRQQDPELLAEQREIQGQIDRLKGYLSKGLTVVSAAASGGTSSIAAAAGAEGTLMRQVVDQGLKTASGAISPDRVAGWIADAVYDRELNSVKGRLARSNAFQNQAALLQLVNQARTKQRLMTSKLRTFHADLSRFEDAKNRLRTTLDRLGEQADRRAGGGRRGYSSFASILGDTDALVIQIDLTKRLGEAEQDAADEATSARRQIEGTRNEEGQRTGAMQYFTPRQHFQLGNWTPWGGRRYGGLVWRASSNTILFGTPGRVVGSAYGGRGAANPIVAETLVELNSMREEAESIRRALSSALGVTLSGGGGGSGTARTGGINAGSGGHP